MMDWAMLSSCMIYSNEMAKIRDFFLCFFVILCGNLCNFF
jgi:hypothetical protein